LKRPANWAAAALLLWTHLAWGAVPAPAAGDKEGALPQSARTYAQWSALIDELRSKQLWYGLMAASTRMPVVLPDVKSKRKGIETAMLLGEMGYPVPVKSLFLSADLEPDPGNEFADNYYFYKALVNQEHGLKKWADYYFRRVSADKSEVYQFYQAVKAYGDKDIAQAKKLLSGLLEKANDTRSLFFTKRIARTLARIQFEEKDFSGSLDIYQSFLLKLPVVTPSDWLEAAWDLYHLKKYPEALGMLYNLESHAGAGDTILVEKYVLRGLIYHALCNRPLIDKLIAKFEAEHKSAVGGVRTGEALARYPSILKIQTARNAPYFELKSAVEGLRRESSEVGRLASATRGLANYLYNSELALLTAKLKALEPQALAASAEALLLTHEGLRFISFEITKSKFDPEKVFKGLFKPQAPLVEKEGDQLFHVIWLQPGDFWREERLKYIAEVENACTN
jgi:hypothetical protein